MQAEGVSLGINEVSGIQLHLLLFRRWRVAYALYGRRLRFLSFICLPVVLASVGKPSKEKDRYSMFKLDQGRQNTETCL